MSCEWRRSSSWSAADGRSTQPSCAPFLPPRFPPFARSLIGRAALSVHSTDQRPKLTYEQLWRVRSGLRRAALSRAERDSVAVSSPFQPPGSI